MQNVKLNFGRLCQGMLQMLWCQAVPKRNWSSLQNIQFLELLVTSSLGSSLDLGSPWITAILGNSHCMLALPLHLLMPAVTLGYQICPLFWFITAFFFFVCVFLSTYFVSGQEFSSQNRSCFATVPHSGAAQLINKVVCLHLWGVTMTPIRLLSPPIFQELKEVFIWKFLNTNYFLCMRIQITGMMYYCDI